MVRLSVLLFIVAALLIGGTVSEVDAQSAGAEYIVKKNYDYFDWFDVTVAANADTTISFHDEKTNVRFKASYISFYVTAEAYGKYFEKGYKDSMQLQGYLSGFQVEMPKVAGDSLFMQADTDEATRYIGFAGGWRN